MNDQELSVHFGHNKNFLAEMKHRDIKKYELVKEMGLPEYEEWARQVRTDLGQMYWEVKDREDMTFKELYDNHCRDISNSYYSMLRYINVMAFAQIATSPQLRSLERMSSVLLAFSEYKKVKDDRKG